MNNEKLSNNGAYKLLTEICSFPSYVELEPTDLSWCNKCVAIILRSPEAHFLLKLRNIWWLYSLVHVAWIKTCGLEFIFSVGGLYALSLDYFSSVIASSRYKVSFALIKGLAPYPTHTNLQLKAVYSSKNLLPQVN